MRSFGIQEFQNYGEGRAGRGWGMGGRGQGRAGQGRGGEGRGSGAWRVGRAEKKR